MTLISFHLYSEHDIIKKESEILFKFFYILYNVGGSWSVLNPNCTVIPLRTPFGLVIPLFTTRITRHYNHTQLSITRLRVYTIIITYTLVTKVTYNTLTRLHSLTSQLSITFTNYRRLYIFTLPVSVSCRDLTHRADFHRLTRRTARY
jgi:hypothetical protein